MSSLSDFHDILTTADLNLLDEMFLTSPFDNEDEFLLFVIKAMLLNSNPQHLSEQFGISLDTSIFICSRVVSSIITDS